MKEFPSRANKVRLALSYRITARIVYQDQHGLFLGTLFTIILDGIDEQSLFKEVISVEDTTLCSVANCLKIWNTLLSSSK